MTIYRDYSRGRIGWFFGLTAWQLAAAATAPLPTLWAIHTGRWSAVLPLLLAAVGVSALAVVPVRGRSAIGWFAATTTYTAGQVAGWSMFGSRAARGHHPTPDLPDLPGPLAALDIHEGPPAGPTQRRAAVIQNHAAKTWAMTAAVVHPGIGMAEPAERDRLGTGLADLLDLCSRTELIDEVLLMVRTVPDDGAERRAWIARHRATTAPALATRVNDELHHALSTASVRTEAFVTIVVPETRLARHARHTGRGLQVRLDALHLLAGEVDAHLRTALGMHEVTWLTSPELAAACRTGFAPDDRPALVDATSQTGQQNVPWSIAGPSGAATAVRHYRHDAWASVSATLRLPDKGAVMGALAPILTPTALGERRSYVAAFPILTQTSAERRTASSEWAADIGDALRDKAKVKQRARARDEADKVRALDRKLARGSAMTQPYAVCTVTIPLDAGPAEFGRRLDGSIRRAGFAPLRLDLAHDVAFAASTIPLGISLTRTTA